MGERVVVSAYVSSVAGQSIERFTRAVVELDVQSAFAQILVAIHEVIL
jgi:hypothetical protein